MNENKRIFLTGALIAGLLLITPYYLQLIGLQPVEENSLSSTENIEKLETVSSVKPKINKKTNKSLYINEKENKELLLNIKTSSLDLMLSNSGGGAIKKATLLASGDDSYKYLGGFNENDVYEDSINVSLILNPSNCAPCLSSAEEEIYDLPFSVVSVNGREAFNNETFSVQGEDSLTVVMSFVDNNIEITKKTVFYGGGYVINHEFFIDHSKYKDFFVSWEGGLRPTEKDRSFELSQYTMGYVGQEKNIESLSYLPSSLSDDSERNNFKGKTDWVAIRNKYFINALIAPSALGGYLEASPFSSASNDVLPEYSAGLEFKNQNNISFSQFLGPLDVDHILKTNTYLDRVMNFGWVVVQPISRSILWLLKALHSVGLNYGVVLIVFALLIRVVTGPLTKKSHESSQNMQKIQPKIKKIQTKYKNDSQKMNKEIMKLYTESGVNPLGGCLPMLIQMPLLFSLFIVFRSTIEFRGASFMLWINNLSQPDAVLDLPFHIPIYGSQVAVLPVFLGLSMFLSQKLSMATMDPKQKPMMYIMSGFFFLLFNQFPSGLNLYYMVYNLLNYQQQKAMRGGNSSGGASMFASFGKK